VKSCGPLRAHSNLASLTKKLGRKTGTFNCRPAVSNRPENRVRVTYARVPAVVSENIYINGSREDSNNLKWWSSSLSSTTAEVVYPSVPTPTSSGAKTKLATLLSSTNPIRVRALFPSWHELFYVQIFWNLLNAAAFSLEEQRRCRLYKT